MWLGSKRRITAVACRAARYESSVPSLSSSSSLGGERWPKKVWRALRKSGTRRDFGTPIAEASRSNSGGKLEGRISISSVTGGEG